MLAVEKTQPGIFHIHIDALEMTEELYQYAVQELNFFDSDFIGHPEGFVHFEPNRHLTLKVNAKERFNETWSALEKFTNSANLKGYLEGEYIPTDDFIPYRDYSDRKIPFKITRRRLNGSKMEEFRQTEIHLTMDKDKSDPKLIQKLLEAGLYGAYIPKKHGTFIVLTIQGFIKEIVPLCETIKEFIQSTGGAYACTIKEERALKYKLYGVSQKDLPEIADTIEYYN